MQTLRSLKSLTFLQSEQAVKNKHRMMLHVGQRHQKWKINNINVTIISFIIHCSGYKTIFNRKI